MKELIKKVFVWLFRPIQRRTIDPIVYALEEERMLIAKLLIREIRTGGVKNDLRSSEFRVFSQTGEDGIIQFLISRVPIENDIFIEFGVEDYAESNTRFLLMNDNWRGLVIDGSMANVEKIKKSSYFWRRELTAVCGFINKDNINDLIRSGGIAGDIGLLSVDIDGNDYWVWESINVVSPRIVVCEYNGLFGPREAVSIPYSESFVRTEAHYSRLYFGTSLKALCVLAEKKGYAFVGCDSGGVNAFFVRKDVAADLPHLSCEEGYVRNRVRESIDRNGKYTYLTGDDRIKLVQDMPVVDVVTGERKLIKDLALY